MENSTTDKPGTATIGANSKAQNCLRGRFGTQFFPKYGKKVKGPDPLETLEIFEQN